MKEFELGYKEASDLGKRNAKNIHIPVSLWRQLSVTSTLFIFTNGMF